MASLTLTDELLRMNLHPQVSVLGFDQAKEHCK